MRSDYLSEVISILLVLSVAYSCKNDSQAEGTDRALYDMARETTGFTWYKNSDALLNTTSGSGHSFPFLRTRYNQTASVNISDAGKIVEGSTFPEGSLIVKEFYDSKNRLARYAVLYKETANVDADAHGWVWGYINADGTVAQAASKKGSGCVDCHNQSGNVNYTLMNKYFP